jgi:hypothetical protein
MQLDDRWTTLLLWLLIDYAYMGHINDNSPAHYNKLTNILSADCVNPPTLQVAPILLSVQPFPYNSIWFVEIFVRGSIPRLFLVRVIMKVVENTVEGVKFTFPMMAYTVWHLRMSQAAIIAPLGNDAIQRPEIGLNF